MGYPPDLPADGRGGGGGESTSESLKTLTLPTLWTGILFNGFRGLVGDVNLVGLRSETGFGLGVADPL